MSHKIDLFMWSRQDTFRRGLELFAKRIIEDARASMEVERDVL